MFQQASHSWSATELIYIVIYVEYDTDTNTKALTNLTLWSAAKLIYTCMKYKYNFKLTQKQALIQIQIQIQSDIQIQIKADK